ncbi:MAG: DNA-processing protein DprA [Bacteroidia bacterium]|nr:DNA-processing protein DprA [Bacteroidia bacterium]
MERDKVIQCAFAKAFLYKSDLAGRLLGELSSAETIYKLPPKEFCELVGGDSDFACSVFSAQNLLWAEKEVEWAESKGVKMLFRGDEDYPQLLSDCEDAPVMLFYKGNANLNNPKTISVVGTRLASGYGKECCREIVESISSYSPLIVSGLAYGIDIAAHRAALEIGVETVAVLPNGLDMIYPLRHRDEAARMVERGGVLTEFFRGMQPLKCNFVKRNRIIAGISSGVVIVESRVKGGSMITVEFASMYNREVLAVPGRLSDSNSYGCNYLISKNVASIYSCSLSIPSALGWDREKYDYVQLQPNLFSSDIAIKEKILLTLKVLRRANIDLLSAKTGVEWGILSVVLLELELEGTVCVNKMQEYYLK